MATITTEPNKEAAEVHDHMPVMFEPITIRTVDGTKSIVRGGVSVVPSRFA